MKPEGYEPLSGRAKWTQRALITLIALDAVSVISGYFEYSLYGQDVITQDELDMNDLRQASDPEAPAAQGAGWHDRSVPALWQWWWGVFIVWGFVDRFAFRISWSANDVSSYQSAAGASMAADSMSIVAGILALLVV